MMTPMMIVLLALSAPPEQPAPEQAVYRASLLSDARVRDDLSLATGDGRFSMDIGLFGQVRYTSAFLNDPVGGGEDVSLGGSIRRNKLKFKGNVGSKDVKYNINFATAGGGSRVILENMNVTGKLGDGWAARVGQGKTAYWLERSISSGKQLAADRSRVARVFGQGYSQFAELSLTRENWRAFATVSDGLKSQNTNFTGTPADVALTLRGEYRSGDASFKSFGDFSAFPESDSGLLLGGAVHYQTGGETFGTVDGDHISALGDVTYRGDGWSAHAAGIWRSTQDAMGTDFTDYGLLVQGGYFVNEHDELFARWDTVFSDSARGGSSDTFSTLTGGVNHFLFENSHAAVITGDVQYLFDASDGDLIGGTTSLGQLADAGDGQVVIRVQLQVSF